MTAITAAELEKEWRDLPENLRDAYRMGYDCGKNGPNITNCHFWIFSSPENTRAWERGKSYAEAARKP